MILSEEDLLPRDIEEYMEVDLDGKLYESVRYRVVAHVQGNTVRSMAESHSMTSHVRDKLTWGNVQ
jgi:hypothetical protein